MKTTYSVLPTTLTL